MPTKAEQIRSTVLQQLEDGASEEQAAHSAGISMDRVLQILDSVEAPARREPVPQQEKRTSLPRSSQRTPAVRYKVQSSTDRRYGQGAGTRPPAPDNSIQRRFPNISPEQSKAKHGTPSGYKALHTRFGLKPCAECKEAVRQLSARKRHNKREHFETFEQAHSACSTIMVPYFCEDHGCWHIVSKSVQTFYLTESQVTA